MQHSLEATERLIARCECARIEEVDSVLSEVVAYFYPNGHERIEYLVEVGAYLDAADRLVPAPGVWRAYTDRCCTVYGASPFNAAMQTRYDGFSNWRPLALCAAILRMAEAKLKRAQPKAQSLTPSLDK